jgi:phosphohistidine phosphatase SixA
MLTSLTLATLTIGLGFAHPDTTELKADSLLKAMRQGGYTIILRHARTDRSVMDDPRYVDAGDRTKQRNLSDAGIADAKAIGLVMRHAAIPFSEIVSSPLFRTKETAQMAFGEPTLSVELRTMEESASQRALIAKAPTPGTNRALIVHHFIIERYVPGISLGEIGESEAAVIRTAPNGEITMVGRFTLADWERLSGGKTGAVNVAEMKAAQDAFRARHGAVGQSPAGAGGAVTPFDWTATPATQLAGKYLHAFNSGSPEMMREFIEKSLVADPNRSTDQRVETYRGMFSDHGAMSIVGTERSEHNEVSVRVRSKRGEFSLIVTVSHNDHTRAASIRLAG